MVGGARVVGPGEVVAVGAAGGDAIKGRRLDSVIDGDGFGSGGDVDAVFADEVDSDGVVVGVIRTAAVGVGLRARAVVGIKAEAVAPIDDVAGDGVGDVGGDGAEGEGVGRAFGGAAAAGQAHESRIAVEDDGA